MDGKERRVNANTHPSHRETCARVCVPRSYRKIVHLWRATLARGGAIVGAPESNPENPPYPTGPMIALLVVGASAFRAPASHMSRRAALTGVASAGLATAVPANAAYSGGSDFGKTPAERGEISRAELEARLETLRAEAAAKRDAAMLMTEADEAKSPEVRHHELQRLQVEKLTAAMSSIPIKDARWITLGDSPMSSLTGLIAGLQDTLSSSARRE